MACDVTYEELASFSAGDLSEPRGQRVREHLEGCGSCQRRLAALGRADAILSAIVQAPPPEDAVDRARVAVLREVRGTPEIMTLAEVADFLRVKGDDLQEIADELPAFELAGQVRVRRAKLIEWIEQRERDHMRGMAQSQAARSLRGVFERGVA